MIALVDEGHGHQRGRNGWQAGTGVPVHRLKLGLDCFVEDVVPVLAKEGEQLALVLAALERPPATNRLPAPCSARGVQLLIQHGIRVQW